MEMETKMSWSSISETPR